MILTISSLLDLVCFFNFLKLIDTLGPSILLHDMRKTSDPIFEFKGHVKQQKNSTIYRPVFVDFGNSIVVGGPNTDILSLYRYTKIFFFRYNFLNSTNTGNLVSRGSMGFKSSNVISRTEKTLSLAVGQSKGVTLFKPVRK